MAIDIDVQEGTAALREERAPQFEGRCGPPGRATP